MPSYFGCDGENTAGTTTGTDASANDFLQGLGENVLMASGGVAAEAGTPTHVSLWFRAPGSNAGEPSSLYVGVYAGGADNGTYWEPDGATLLGQTTHINNLYGEASPSWHTWALDGTPTGWTAGQRVWLAAVGRDTSASARNEMFIIDAITGNLRGDFTQLSGSASYMYMHYTTGVSTSPAGLPSSFPSGGSGNNYPIIGYITYSTGGGTARGMPFGIRSTVFNGGRVLTGPIN
jgi:hypothetical protein